MNYPVWELDVFGGGLFIALIAVFHVYISHFAVGGGLFLVLTEIKGLRARDEGILEYVRRHTRFFLLLTMVAGGITGVGIWFTIALLNPAATSSLIHTFVFGWATEWVFFTIEILALFIYYYTFDRLNSRDHLIIGWIYFGAAWMSLFIINGIIDFMLTPGSWLENNNFWAGFFNPTFWPALFFRSFLAFMIAGMFGLLTSTWIREEKLRTTMVRYCALWLLLPFGGFLASAWWYRRALPPELEQLIFQAMPEMRPFITGFVLFSPLLILGGLLMAARIPTLLSRPLAAMILIIGLMYMGTFEFLREGGRRPYIIRDYMYSTSILKRDLDMVKQKGVLQEAKWVSHRNITEENRLEAGRQLYNILCLPCHAIGGPLNDIKPLAAPFSPSGLQSMILSMDKIHPYMPPFAGTREEAGALAWYIAHGLNGRTDRTRPVALPAAAARVPEFDRENAGYVLLAWSDFGMRSLTDASATWFMLPPGVNLEAQLIRRGETPEVVTEGVTLHYEVDRPFSHPSTRIDFWDSLEKLPGMETVPPPDTGLAGKGLEGTMTAEDIVFRADLLPVVPYTDSGYMPYPQVTVRAVDEQGRVLARTRAVLPVATEMNCRTCHGGPWKKEDRAGISTATAMSVLAAHDRLSGTRLQEQAASGQPVLCQQCHHDPLLAGKGLPQAGPDSSQLNLSAAIHGFHAIFLADLGAKACTQCHPAGNEGATRALRGIHHNLEMDCTNCHGSLSDHALALLKGEQEQGKAHADELIHHLAPEAVTGIDEISPRQPWINEPDCLNCHQDFQPPETEETFNIWTADRDALFRNRTDESGQLRCIGCHNSAHALYPAQNPYNDQLDVIQPLQYQSTPFPIGSDGSCDVCHTVEMEDEMHHPNMLRPFRNQ